MPKLGISALSVTAAGDTWGPDDDAALAALLRRRVVVASTPAPAGKEIKVIVPATAPADEVATLVVSAPASADEATDAEEINANAEPAAASGQSTGWTAALVVAASVLYIEVLAIAGLVAHYGPF